MEIFHNLILIFPKYGSILLNVVNNYLKHEECLDKNKKVDRRKNNAREN